MSKFVYKFDSIIRVKEILEKKILKEISDIEKEIEKLEKNKNLLIMKRKKLSDSISSGLINANDYKSAKTLHRSMGKEIISVEKKIEDWKNKKNMKIDELKERKKEKRVFETLKEHQYEEFVIESNREELKRLNEVAINNFNRKES